MVKKAVNKETNQKLIFELKTINVILLKQIFECIKRYLTEAAIQVTPDGLVLSTFDSSRVSLTKIDLHKSKFEKFYCRPAGFKLGISPDTLFKALKSANRKETIILYMTEDEEDKLIFQLTDSELNKKKEYKINILHLDEDPVQIEDKKNEELVLHTPNVKVLKYDHIISMPSSQFRQIIKDVEVNDGNALKIESIQKQIKFSAMGDDKVYDFGVIFDELNDDKSKITYIKSDNKIVQGIFNLNYLSFFIKVSQISDVLKIHLTNDKPLVLEYNFLLGNIKFLLKPMET